MSYIALLLPAKFPDVHTMLCKICNQIFRGPCRVTDHDHHLDSHSLERAAFECCDICQVLWRAISDNSPNGETSDTHTAQGNVEDPNPASRYYIVHQSYWTKGVSEVNFTVYKKSNKNGIDRSIRDFTFYLSRIDRKADLSSNSIVIHLP